ncbi:MAG TPA: hypothetical protein VHB73_04935 [Alphaproteobacteria bacterium]|nr:hypothetical protein [Alphaproteobacteria bacterium]
MFGFGRPPRRTPLDELKERLSLPTLKDAEGEVREFYEGRNPYEHLKAEWPLPYSEFVIGFASALQRCRQDGIVEWKRREVIASMCAMTMARATFKSEAA